MHVIFMDKIFYQQFLLELAVYIQLAAFWPKMLSCAPQVSMQDEQYTSLQTGCSTSI